MLVSSIKITFFVFFFSIIFPSTYGQDVERKLPEGWDKIVHGGRFMDRFQTLPKAKKMSKDVWGIDKVKPRDIENGLEDNTWSYWGGNIFQSEDQKFHMFVCRWLENNPKGHRAWPKSEVVHAVSDNPSGPYKVLDKVGRGHSHNPEMHQLKDGRYFIYVNQFSGDLYYLADQLEGPWTMHPFTYDPRERSITDHIANNTFLKRDDGSMLMVTRGG